MHPWKYLIYWNSSRWHQDIFWLYYLVGRTWTDGWTLCEYFRFYGLSFGTMIQSSFFFPSIFWYTWTFLYYLSLFSGLAGKIVITFSSQKICSHSTSIHSLHPYLVVISLLDKWGKHDQSRVGHNTTIGNKITYKLSNGGLDGPNLKTCWHDNSTCRCC